MSIFGWSYPPGCSGTPYDEDTGFDTVCEWMEEVVLADFPPGFDVAWLAEDLASRLGKTNQDVADALLAAAKAWERAESQKRHARRPEEA